MTRALGLVARLYPSDRRAEVVNTARDTLEGQGRLGRAREVADLIAHAIRERTGMTATSGPGIMTSMAARLAAGSAISLSVTFLFLLEWRWRGPKVVHTDAGPIYLTTEAKLFGPFTTLGPLMYVPWLLIFAAAIAGHALLARRLTGVAVVVSLALLPLSPLVGIGRPSLTVIGPMAVFGLIVLAAPVDPLRRDPAGGRAFTIGVTALTSLFAGLAIAYRDQYGANLLWYRGDEITSIAYTAGALLAALLGGSLLSSRWNPWLPLAVGLVIVPWTVFISGTPSLPNRLVIARNGALALALFTAVAIVTYAAAKSRNRNNGSQERGVPS